MTVRVLFFASLRERVGQAEIQIELGPGSTVKSLWKILGQMFPKLASADIKVAFAVNQEYVDTSQRLGDNDEIAIIPPVSGGSPLDYQRCHCPVSH